jgi:hypothetical protein
VVGPEAAELGLAGGDLVLELVDAAQAPHEGRHMHARGSGGRAYGTVYVMERTTVYLTHDLRLALKQTAGRRRVSEAELIREGIAWVTAEEEAPAPTLPLFESGDATLAERVDDELAGFGER